MRGAKIPPGVAQEPPMELGRRGERCPQDGSKEKRESGILPRYPGDRLGPRLKISRSAAANLEVDVTPHLSSLLMDAFTARRGLLSSTSE